MEEKQKNTMIRLKERDLQAILRIRAYYGVNSDNQAIILAINLIARYIEGQDAAPKLAGNGKKESKSE